MTVNFRSKPRLVIFPNNDIFLHTPALCGERAVGHKQDRVCLSEGSINQFDFFLNSVFFINIFLDCIFSL